MASTDVADRVAAEVADWIESRSQQVADAILESVYRPRVVEPTRAETIAYFRPLLVNPDGSLNEAGKQSVIQQYGASGYEGIARALAKAITAEKDAILAATPPIDLSAAAPVDQGGTPPPAPGAPPLQPIRARPPTNTQLILGQLPEPGPGGTPLLATPGGA